MSGTLPEGLEWRIAMMDFQCLERFCITVHAGNAYKLLFNQLFVTPDKVMMFRTLQHVEVYDIGDDKDAALKSMS